MGSPNVDWNKIFEFSWRILVFVVAIGIIVVVSTNWTRWEGGAGWQTTDDAYLRADTVTVAPRVSGYIDQIYVADNQLVKAGDPLLRIDLRNYQAVLSQQDATVDARDADIRAAENQVKQQEAGVEQALEHEHEDQQADQEQSEGRHVALATALEMILGQLAGVDEQGRQGLA